MNRQEVLHNAQQASSEYLRMVRTCQLAIKKSQIAVLVDNLNAHSDSAYRLASVNPYWFECLNQAKLIPSSPLVHALLQASSVSLKIAISLGFTKQTYRHLHHALVLSVYITRSFFLNESFANVTRAQLKQLGGTVFKQTNKLIQQLQQKNLVSAELNLTYTSPLSLFTSSQFRSSFYIGVNYLFNICKPLSNQRDPIATVVTSPIVNTPNLCHALVLQQLQSIAQRPKILSFAKINDTPILNLEFTKGQQVEQLNYIENQKKPSNWVLSRNELPADAKYSNTRPTFKLEQLSNLALKIIQYLVQTQQFEPQYRLLNKAIQFNAPQIQSELMSKIDRSSISNLTKVIERSEVADDILELAAKKSSSRKLTLQHAISMLGVERLPLVILKVRIRQVFTHHQTEHSPFVYNKLSSLLSVIDDTAHVVYKENPAEFERFAYFVFMNVMVYKRLNEITPSELLQRFDSNETSLLSMYGVRNKTNFKTIAGQICVNWLFDKNLLHACEMWFDYQTGNTPIRLIPKKYHKIFVTLDLTIALFKSSQGNNSPEHNASLANLWKKVKFNSDDASALLERVINNSQPQTRFF